MYTIREGYAPFRHYQTWFRVCGDIDSGLTPLVVAHGGPGCTHDYVDAFRDIALSGRAVIHYDQLGNGRSTHLPQQPPTSGNRRCSSTNWLTCCCISILPIITSSSVNRGEVCSARNTP